MIAWGSSVWRLKFVSVLLNSICFLHRIVAKHLLPMTIAADSQVTYTCFQSLLNTSTMTIDGWNYEMQTIIGCYLKCI